MYPPGGELKRQNFVSFAPFSEPLLTLRIHIIRCATTKVTWSPQYNSCCSLRQTQPPNNQIIFSAKIIYYYIDLDNNLSWLVETGQCPLTIRFWILGRSFDSSSSCSKLIFTSFEHDKILWRKIFIREYIYHNQPSTASPPAFQGCSVDFRKSWGTKQKNKPQAHIKRK